MTIRDKANINNLTALWSTVGLACGAYCSKTSYSFSTILNSQWPNRVWLNAPPNWGIINEILNSCGQNKLPKSLSYWADFGDRSEEHTSELQSRPHLVCRLLLEKKNKQ